MRKILDNITWIVLFLFLVPSGLAVASWNSLPGHLLFNMKLSVEDTLVSVIPSSETKGNLQVVFTEQRFSEAKQLLASNNSQGLVYLDNQVVATKQSIVAAKDPVVRRQLAQKYIASLRTMSSQLQEQRQIIAANRPVQTTKTGPSEVDVVHVPAVVYQTNITQVNKTIVIVQSPTPLPSPTPVPEVASDDDAGAAIDNSQANIDNTIADLEQLSGGTEDASPAPTDAPLPPVQPAQSTQSNNQNGQGGSHQNENNNGNGFDGFHRDN